MSWFGIVLIVVSFVLLTPKGGVPGSTAARNIRIGAMPIATTPGYQHAADGNGKRRWYQVCIGVVLLAAGILLLIVSS
jgi:hypothetical protein